MADRVPRGRIGRLARVGYAAAHQAARQAGTRAVNMTRSEEQAQAALERRQLETAEQIVNVLGGMKGAAFLQHMCPAQEAAGEGRVRRLVHQRAEGGGGHGLGHGRVRARDVGRRIAAMGALLQPEAHGGAQRLPGAQIQVRGLFRRRRDGAGLPAFRSADRAAHHAGLAAGASRARLEGAVLSQASGPRAPGARAAGGVALRIAARTVVRIAASGLARGE